MGYRENGKGPYLWISYSEIIERTEHIGCGLINKGVQADNSTNIGIYSKNRVEVEMKKKLFLKFIKNCFI